MTNALLPILGGPIGRHARSEGLVFRPLPWAMLVAGITFTLLYVRHLPCLTTDPGNPINAYIRACYTDVATRYSFEHWAGGVGLGATGSGDLPPLLAVVVAASRWVSALLGWRLGEEPAHAYVGLPDFFGVTAIVLFAAFLCLVLAVGRWTRAEGRAWDVLYVAASPAVLAAGLVAWDLLPLAACAWALVALRTQRDWQAGVLLGLACSMAGMPVAVAAAVWLALILAARWHRLLAVAGTTMLVIAVTQLPRLLANPEAVWGALSGEIRTDVSYGSWWFLLQSAGVPLREIGPLAFACTLLALGVGASWLWVSGRRPAGAELVAATLLVVVLLAPAYPPQTGLWLVVALVLAQRVDRVLWAYAVVQLLHYLAVWGWLGGHLSIDGGGPFVLYYLAVLLRIALECWLLGGIVLGWRKPAADRQDRSVSVDDAGRRGRAGRARG